MPNIVASLEFQQDDSPTSSTLTAARFIPPCPDARPSLSNLFNVVRAVVVKTIRADTGVGGPNGDASGLLVVHLVRDPRAVINSQIKTFNVAHKYRRYFNSVPPENNPSQKKNATVAEKPPEADAAAGAAAGVGNGLTSLPWGGQERARTLGLM